MTGGSGQEWISKHEIHLQSCLDWLLKDDKEIVEMLIHERQLIDQHRHKDACLSPMSLAHQAVRQDPGIS